METRSKLKRRVNLFVPSTCTCLHHFGIVPTLRIYCSIASSTAVYLVVACSVGQMFVWPYNI
ncbi:hypothetical protein BCR44DRAFT_1257629 [Catenaria anguillulae PL171]|uniref:Transmembrane protein n=1 Tax=Catenaria anguillulae PL171 TaxID=765915 RepID=A0A1Y2HD77_9FUNG|nr:hypothetical protein BCR44DRAFT_1257629 [Catenaria anguillulae PL171]